ncbi:carbamoyl-phosphate synthase domain-containing protein [Actinomadura welshii]
MRPMLALGNRPQTRQGIVGIAGIDTRSVVRHLRRYGSMKAGVFSGKAMTEPLNIETLVQHVRTQQSMLGADLAGEASTPDVYVVEPEGKQRFTVAALDLQRYGASW